LQVDLLVIRHGKQLAVCKALCIRPVIRFWLAHDPRDLLKLIHFRRSREKRLEGVKLSHNAAEGKDVDRVIVGATTEDIFRRPVPPSGHVLRERRRVSNLLNQAEVAQLDERLLLYQNVFWFDISVEESVAMNVVERRGNLHGDVTDLFVRKRVVVELAHLHHAVKVHVE
jgi:hypothetical protein